MLKSLEKEQDRKMIIKFYKINSDKQYIQDELAKIEIYYSISQINRVIDQYLKDESLELNYFGNKNAQKRTEEFSKNLSNEIESNQNASIRQIANNQTVNPDGLSKETVRRELKQQGFNSYKLGQRLPSTENSREERYHFLKKHKNWKDRWLSVHFTDKCLIRSNEIGQKYAWAQSKDQVDYSKAPIKSRFSKVQVHFWAMISSEGAESIHLLTENMTSQNLIEIYKTYLPNDFSKTRQILQFNNAPPHKAKNTINFLIENNLEYLNFPPYSPDLSIIENIFSIIKEELINVIDTIETSEQFFSRIKTIFYESQKIKKTIINSYISYHKRIGQAYNEIEKEFQ